MPRREKTEQQRRGERAAGQHIGNLSGGSRAYRALWEAQADKITPGEVNQAAVCQVLAQYLWDAGLESDTRTHLPRILKDPVSRALRGVGLSPRLFRTILAAFDFAEDDAEFAKDLYRGAEPPNVIIGNLPALVVTPTLENRRYKTISLHHFHYLGPDGVPVRHRTLRDIRALADGVTVYRFSADTTELTVDRIGGGTPGEQYSLAENMWSVDIRLPRTLNLGDEHSLEFETRFHYRNPPEPNYRTIAHSRLENISTRVQFHPDKLPRKVWSTEWQDYRKAGATIVCRELVPLDAEHVVYRRLDVLDHAVVGFMWEF